MAKEETITIRIKKWNKFNPRGGDSKKPNWFRMDNDILDHEDLFDLTPDQFKALVFIFCQASKKNSDTVRIRFAHASEKYKLKAEVIMSTIFRLKQSDIVERVCELTRASDEKINDPGESRTDPGGTRTDLPATENTENTENTAKSNFDFLTLYKKYPRKRGKEEGMKRLKKRIVDQDTYDDFARAVHNYAEECRIEATAPRFMKHWSTFVGTDELEPWLDYVEWQPSQYQMASGGGICGVIDV